MITFHIQFHIFYWVLIPYGTHCVVLKLFPPLPQPAENKGGGGGVGGPKVSVYAVDEEEVKIPDDQKSVFDWCKEGQVARLAEMVTEQNVNQKDDQVCQNWCLYQRN